MITSRAELCIVQGLQLIQSGISIMASGPATESFYLKWSEMTARLKNWLSRSTWINQRKTWKKASWLSWWWKEMRAAAKILRESSSKLSISTLSINYPPRKRKTVFLHWEQMHFRNDSWSITLSRESQWTLLKKKIAQRRTEFTWLI